MNATFLVVYIGESVCIDTLVYLRRAEAALCQGKELTSARDHNDGQKVSRPPMTVILTVLMRPDDYPPRADHVGDIQWIGIRHDCKNEAVGTPMEPNSIHHPCVLPECHLARVSTSHHPSDPLAHSTRVFDARSFSLLGLNKMEALDATEGNCRSLRRAETTNMS